MGNATTTRNLEHKMLEYTASLHKRPMAWHDALVDCGDLNGCTRFPWLKPATDGVPTTVVDAFRPGFIKKATPQGYVTVQSDFTHLYLDGGDDDPVVYSKKLWYDIAGGEVLTEAERDLFIGGGVSLWGDNYCSGTAECGGWSHCPDGSPPEHCVPATGWMQNKSQDFSFFQSAGGKLWP